MASVPDPLKIYHITHLDNLPSIATGIGLVSDARRIASRLSCSVVGMSTIKQRRLEEIGVPCHPDTKVGEYVPFYFCPRSIMLYILHRSNHPELSYAGGQQPIVHLQANFRAVIDWADSNQVPWVFSTGNAGAYLTRFYNDPTNLGEIEFDVFPWTLIDKIGTINSAIATKVKTSLVGIVHQPAIAVEPTWYF